MFIPRLRKIDPMYSAFTDKVERNCHFSAGTARLTAKRYSVFPIQVSLHKTIKSSIAVPAGK
jgi:hypothetical protein